jgi:hypothetical protein
MDNKENLTNKTEKENDIHVNDNLETTEKFILEYPSNYHEICEHKLKQMEMDYQEVMRCNFAEEDLKMCEDSLSSDEHEQDIGEDNHNCQGNDDKYYQCLNECENFDDDDEGFIEVQENTNEKKEIENPNIDTNSSTNINTNTNNNTNTIPLPKEDPLDGLEFYMTKTDENAYKESRFEMKEPGGPKITFISRDPVKNPEKIKETMRSINMNPPKWAQKYIFYLTTTTQT